MISAYYNENDPFAAAWLRELIKADLIAPGEVDERGIEEIKPDDLRGFTQCHFFAGIGVWSYALRNAGWPDDSPVWTGSCPCQGFSASGQRGGFSDKRHLWPAWFRLIRECRPVTVFGEQVASKDGLAWLDVVSADMEAEGYAIGAADICAAGFGAPHIRQRLYFVADYPTSRREQERENTRRNFARDRQERNRAGLNPSRSTCDMDKPNRAGSQQRRETGASVGYGSAAITTSSASDLGQSEGDGRIRRENNGDEGRRERASRSTSETGGVVHTERRRWNGRQDLTEQTERGDGNISESTSQELTNGFWRDAEWIYCQDEKWRPVEPGAFPLAHGTTNRVGRLRGYGNAINAEVAMAFIGAYMSLF